MYMLGLRRLPSLSTLQLAGQSTVTYQGYSPVQPVNSQGSPTSATGLLVYLIC